MRTKTAQDDAIFRALGQSQWLKVEIQDHGGTWRDITNLRQLNFVDGVSWKCDHDTSLGTATIMAKREVFKYSIAPGMTGSVLNLLGGGTALLAPNVRIRFSVQAQPTGGKASSTWNLVFDGRVDKVDWARDPMQIECSDLAIDLQRAFILDERAYGVWQPGQRYIASATVGAVVVPGPGDPTFPNNPDAPTGPWLRCTGSTGTAAANNWVANTSTTNGTVRTPTVPNGFIYTSSGGTHNTGASEPIWPTTIGGTIGDNGLTWTCSQPTPPVWPNVVGNTVSDNGLTWKCVVAANGTPTATPMETQMQMLLDDYTGIGTWTLFTPVATGEVIRPYTQSGMNVLDALQRLADIIGWDVRYRYVNNPAQISGWANPPGGVAGFYLTLYDVNRSNVTAVATFATSKQGDVEVFEQDMDTVRTRVVIAWWDGVNVDPSGNPVLAFVKVTDASHIAGNPIIPCMVAEGSTAGVLSSAAATKMANAILSDFSQAPYHVQVPTELAWWMELSDLVTVKADSLRSDVDQKLAIFGIENAMGADGVGASHFTLRGKPSSGHLRWAGYIAMPGSNGAVKVYNAHQPATPTVVQTISGSLLTYGIPSDRQRRYRHTEIHVSTSNGFVPSSSTLKKASAAGQDLLGSLPAGTTHYARIVHVDRNGNRSPPSPQVTFTPGYISLGSAGSSALNAFHPNLTQNVQAHLSADQVLAAPGGSIAFDTADYDPRSILNAGSNKFVFPEGGQFLIYCKCVVTGFTAGDSLHLQLKSPAGPLGSLVFMSKTANVVTRFASGTGTDVLEAEMTGVVNFSAGDEFEVKAIFGTATGGTPNWTIKGGATKNGNSRTFIAVSQQLA